MVESFRGKVLVVEKWWNSSPSFYEKILPVYGKKLSHSLAFLQNTQLSYVLLLIHA